MTRPAGVTVWLTGLSGSGKTTVATALAELLAAEGRASYVLDGDVLREGLNSDLGFSDADRAENVRRVGEVAKILTGAGFVTLVPLISPFRDGRAAVRDSHARDGLKFVEVFVDTPLEECEHRDAKGLYARARAGEIPSFTGIDSPYEPPLTPDLLLRPDDGDPREMARLVHQLL